MGRFVEGEDRQQPTMLPACLDDYIAEDSPVCAVDAFIDELAGTRRSLGASDLADCGAIHGVAARGYIIDANGNDVAAAQFAIDRQVEEGKVALLAFDLELCSD